ncbi:MAG: hypothetical protein UY09_C0012G0020 [Parcubacteria group bacterium GW2011_GWA2_47_8]|nr:MAG: hypothetical protein UY09_C0012G0020 [Parcubacteria group bacterium GW2011_GWA2_47_8]OHB18759.1 MAG: hypothetical protein A2666_02395 [Parcubacteria group bacterium RIFCSPHIGHO2_01_FULL_47_10b]
MDVVFTDKFKKQYRAAPRVKQLLFNKQLLFLITNLRHPSLRAKIYDDRGRIWQARVDKSWRFLFYIEGSCYYMLTIGPHPK